MRPSHAHKPSGYYQFQACANQVKFDYVFHPEAFSTQPVAMTAIDDQTPLPSYDQPSDHLALTAHFDWH
jgi:hypothetical protein